MITPGPTPIPPGYLKAAALCGLCLAAVLPLVEASAPEAKQGSLLLSTLVLFLIPFGIAASEEGHQDGIIARMADSVTFSRGSLVASALVAAAFFQRTSDLDRAAGVFAMGVVWTQAFLHLESPLAYRIVVGACLALVVLGIAFRASLALALMPLTFTLLALVLLVDLCIERSRRHGIFDRIDLGWPLVTGGAIVTVSLFVGSISFRLMHAALLPAPDPTTVFGRALAPANVGAGTTSVTRTHETRLPPGASHSPPLRREVAPTLELSRGLRPDPTPGAPERTPSSDTGARPSPRDGSRTPAPSPSVATLPPATPSPTPEQDDVATAPGSEVAAAAPAGSVAPGDATEGEVVTGDWSRFSGYVEAPVTWRDRLKSVAEEVAGALLLLALVVALRLSRAPGESDAEGEEARQAAPASAAPLRGLLGRVPPDPRAAVIHLYNRVFEEGRASGLSDDLSSEELAARLQGRIPEAEFHILLLVRSFEQARYSRMPIARDLADHAEEAARLIVKRLRDARAS